MLHLWVVLQLAAGSAAFAGLLSDPRLERLQAWTTDVERHQPGTLDAPAMAVRLWDRAAVSDIRDDMVALTSLIREPGGRVQLFEAPTPVEVRRSKPGYTPRQ